MSYNQPLLNLQMFNRPIRADIFNTCSETKNNIKCNYIGDPNCTVKLTLTDQFGNEQILNDQNFHQIIDPLYLSHKPINGKLEYKYSRDMQPIADFINTKMDDTMKEIEKIANEKIAEKMKKILAKFQEINRLIKENQSN